MRYLPLQHPFRRWIKAFNGEQEFETALRTLSGIEVEQKVLQMSFKHLVRIHERKQTK